MTPKPEKIDDYLAHGEIPPLDPVAFRSSAEEAVEERARSLGKGLAEDHNVVINIDGEDHSLVEGGQKVSHKKELIIGTLITGAAAGLSVAGWLAVRHHARVKHKK